MKTEFVLVSPSGMDGYSIDLRRPRNPVYACLCSGCRSVLPGPVAPDIEVNEPRLLRMALSFVWGIELGIARSSLLDAFDAKAVAEQLVLGRVFNEAGREFPECNSFLGRHRLVVRHAKNGRFKQCATCKRIFYSGDFTRPSIVARQAKEEILYDAGNGKLVCSRKLVNLDMLKGLKGCKVVPLEVIEHATDGLPDVLG